MASTTETTRDSDVDTSKVSNTEARTDEDFENSEPLEEVASTISHFVGHLPQHVQNLEGVKKDIGKEVLSLDTPSIAFKLTDLQTLIHGVVSEVESYIRACNDLRQFVTAFEEDELQSREDMLYFINEIKPFSSPLVEELDKIITAVDKAMATVREHEDTIANNEASAQRSADNSEAETSANEAIQHISASRDEPHNGDNTNVTQIPCLRAIRQKWGSIWRTSGESRTPEQEQQPHLKKALLDKCTKHLEDLTVEVKRVRVEVIAKYTKYIDASLAKYKKASDDKKLAKGIMKIREVCAPDTK